MRTAIRLLIFCAGLGGCAPVRLLMRPMLMYINVIRTRPGHSVAMPSGDPALIRLARALALAAIGLLALMILVTFVTGASQEPFELLAPVDSYREAMRRAAPGLRLVLAADTLFISTYAAFFVVYGKIEGARGVPALVQLGVAALLAAAVLDILEDQHLFALLRASAESGGITADAVRFQHIVSQSKFHVSYVGLFFFGLGLPRGDRFERAFALAIALPVPILGAAIWIAPAELAMPLNILRWFGFLAGFSGALALLGRAPHGEPRPG
jgi:hypothetical protein